MECDVFRGSAICRGVHRGPFPWRMVVLGQIDSHGDIFCNYWNIICPLCPSRNNILLFVPHTFCFCTKKELGWAAHVESNAEVKGGKRGSAEKQNELWDDEIPGKEVIESAYSVFCDSCLGF